MTPRFHFKVDEDGKMILDRQDLLDRYLKWHLKGKRGVMILDQKKNHRSDNQNKLYWAYLGLIEEETGDFASDLHEYFKRALLPPTFIKVLGKTVKIPRSTTDLTKGEMVEYLLKINALTGVAVPDPKDWDFAPLK